MKGQDRRTTGVPESLSIVTPTVTLDAEDRVTGPTIEPLAALTIMRSLKLT